MLTSAYTIWIPSHTNTHVPFSIKFLYLHYLMFKAYIWNTVDSWTIGVRGTDSHAIENPPRTVDSPKLYSQPSVSVRDPPWIPKSSGTHVPYMKWCKTMYTVGLPRLWTPNCGSKIVFGWIYNCKPWGYGGPTVHVLKNNPHISRPMQLKPVQSKGQLYRQLLLLPFGPAQGSYLAKLSSGQVTGTGKNPRQLRAWPWASLSPQYPTAKQQALLD